MLLPLDGHPLPLPSAHTVKMPYPKRNEKTELRTYTMIYMNKTTNQQHTHKIIVDLGQKKMNAAPHLPEDSKLANNQTIHRAEEQCDPCCGVRVVWALEQFTFSCP